MLIKHDFGCFHHSLERGQKHDPEIDFVDVLPCIFGLNYAVLVQLAVDVLLAQAHILRTAFTKINPFLLQHHMVVIEMSQPVPHEDRIIFMDGGRADHIQVNIW